MRCRSIRCRRSTSAAKDLVFNAYPDEMPRFWEMSWK